MRTGCGLNPFLLPEWLYQRPYIRIYTKKMKRQQGNLKRTTNLKTPIFPNVSCPPSLSANKAARLSFSSSFFLTAKGLCPWLPSWLLGVWEEGAGEDDNEDRWEGECISYVLWRLKEGDGLRSGVWLDGEIEGVDEGAKGLFVLSIVNK